MVTLEREERFRESSGRTGSRVMVRCLREIVLCDTASWPAIYPPSIEVQQGEMNRER